ncbi:MAG TPA: DUF1232 domain-containing protein [Fimbriimonas sp.]|nr:DUF1232 domain-containing protein [Fimbriimonas sp.]
MNRPVRFVAAAKNPDLPKPVRWIYLAAAIYILSPVDFVPEAFPIVGLLDDILVFILAITPAIKRWQAKRSAK